MFETAKRLELSSIQITLQDNEDDCYYNDLARDDKQLREQGGGERSELLKRDVCEEMEGELTDERRRAK